MILQGSISKNSAKFQLMVGFLDNLNMDKSLLD